MLLSRKRNLLPELNDFQIRAPNPGGRKARPYKTLINLLGWGGVYPCPNRTGHCSKLLMGISQIRFYNTPFPGDDRNGVAVFHYLIILGYLLSCRSCQVPGPCFCLILGTKKALQIDLESPLTHDQSMAIIKRLSVPQGPQVVPSQAP